MVPGLKLHWDGVESLVATLGENGVTSTYRYDLAPYTWRLARELKAGKALFTQAPTVAENLLVDMGRLQQPSRAVYNGYGSCPLTVERDKIVLAAFGSGGKRLPSFPKWMIDDSKPSRLAWQLKARAVPRIYWQAMLKGREPLAKPEHAA